MLQNYFRTAWRAMKRYKLYSTLNILGLSMGIASCIMIYLVVKYELQYDAFNKKADRIYRVTLNAIDFNSSVSMALAPALQTSFPELEQVSQVWHQSSGMFIIGQNRFNEKNWAYADAQFSKIFDYEWVSGNAATALAEPNSIVLTQSTAAKYFAGQDAMGKIIRYDNSHDLKVTGIVKDLPGNTSFPFDFLVSFETIKKDVQGMMNEFYAIAGGNTYILIPEGYHIETLKKKIPAFIASHWGEDIAKEARLPLQPLREIHFDQRYNGNDFSSTTSKNTYWALTAIAIFIMVIACINFVNLATAQAIRRAREIGVRKVLGSNRAQLMAQFLGETALMVTLALVLALLAIAFLLPLLATWMDVKVNLQQLAEPVTLVVIGAITISMILLAGLYPAFVQSAFNPVQSLKNKSGLSGSSLLLRKSLVVIQFVISQVMIVGTLVVAYQMDFFKNRDLGFTKDAVVSLDVPDKAKREVLRNRLLATPGVAALSFSSGAPPNSSSFSDFASQELGVTTTDVTELKFVDDNYFHLFNLKMLAGQPVIKRTATDTGTNAVVNETMIKKLNIADAAAAIGKHFIVSGRYATITGVVADFQSESKHKKRRPCALFYVENRFYTACLQLQPAGMQQTMAAIDKIWTSLFPDQLFTYEFVDDHIANWYRQEEKQYIAFRLFAGIAILIGCLGLYGLVAFAAAQRKKEVGIRKILGATLGNIVVLFSGEFVVLIAVAFMIAAPLAYYVMHNWLQNFAYQVPISANIFVIAIMVSVLIAGATIAYQAIRAGTANPVKSLRAD